MNEIKQVMMSEDRSRRAEIFLKNDVWHVNMIIGGQLIECRPMVSDGTVHSLRYAEDAAENWCIALNE
ncbi:hypothetical protein OAV13_00555 [bacterium]|jgi:hypothetical protein|nr:hypothetical protein [bacterium]